MRHQSRRSRAPVVLLVASAASCLAGCLERTIRITTEPEGALVWLNDVEVGRTPLETDFTFYGTYDVRIRREGYEPIVTSAKASAPPQEWPGVDLLAEAAPVKFSNVVRWHWVLTPREENTLSPADAESALLSRARSLREDARTNAGARPESAPESATPPDFAQPAPGAGAAPPTDAPQEPPAPAP